MSKQLTLPSIPTVPRWWAWFLPEFVGQPKHFARAKVVGKRYRPTDHFRMGGSMMPSVPVTIKSALLVEVQTPHGTFEVEVSKKFYDLTRKGDVIRVAYRLSRVYAKNQHISGELLQ